MIRRMPFKLPLLLSIVVAVFKDRADLVAENIALRQQLSCFVHRRPRPRLRPVDRVFWVLLSRFWNRWREELTIVKPATVLAWHRKGFKLFWRWKSRERGPGRPRITAEVRKLIVEMAKMNVGWGAPRIHGERVELGINVSEITVSRYMPKRPPPAGSRQRWATFSSNHLHETLAIDFAVVPTATFGIVYVFFVLSLERRRVLHFNVTRHPTAEWTAQQVVEACPFDLPGRFMIRDNERQLRSVIRSYVNYHHEDRTHLGLEKDPPKGRSVEPPETGEVVAIPRVGGLHHRYSRELRRAA